MEIKNSQFKRLKKILFVISCILILLLVSVIILATVLGTKFSDSKQICTSTTCIKYGKNIAFKTFYFRQFIKLTFFIILKMY